MPAMSDSEVEAGVGVEGEEEGIALPTFTMREDGSLTNTTAEKLALVLAEADDLDLSFPQASREQWEAAGGKDSSGSRKYKLRILRYPVFRRRLEDLVSERDEILKDTVWGKATWMVEQGWRWAFCEGDLVSALKFAEMRVKIAEKSGKSPKTAENEGETADNGAKNPVGAPATEPMVDAPVGGARAKLAAMAEKAA